MRAIAIFLTGFLALLLSCKSSLKLSKDGGTSSERSVAVPATVEEKAAKLMSDYCIDPDLALVSIATQLMLCDGTIASGTYTPPTPDFPDVENVLSTDTVNTAQGTLTLPDATKVLSSEGTFGVGGNVSNR